MKYGLLFPAVLPGALSSFAIPGRSTGPTAQDFHAAFGLGDNNTTISTLDPDGVALAAIQELARRNYALEAQVTELQAHVQMLQADRQQTVR